MALVAARLPGLRADRADLRHAGGVHRPRDRVARRLRGRRRGVLRRPAARFRRTASARSSACSCPPPARRRGSRPRAAGRARAASRRRTAARRVRLFTTEVLVEARALYAVRRLPRRRHGARRRAAPTSGSRSPCRTDRLPPGIRPLQCPFHRGRVAQWESARFTHADTST